MTNYLVSVVEHAITAKPALAKQWAAHEHTITDRGVPCMWTTLCIAAGASATGSTFTFHHSLYKLRPTLPFPWPLLHQHVLLHTPSGATTIKTTET